MLKAAMPLLVLALGAAQGASAADDWVVASGTDTCSVSSLDFADSLHGFAAGSFNCGLLTEDGGLTWSPISVVPNHGQSLNWAHAASADDLYAARLGLYRSTDRGATWAEVGSLSTQSGGSFFDVHVFDADNIVSIKGGQIWSTTDGGANWILTFPGQQDMNFHELNFPTDKIGYATGGVVREAGSIGTVLRTDDGGATWNQLDFQFGKISAASFVDADNGMLSTQDQGLFVTTDGAQNWTALPSAPPGLVNQLKHRDAQHWYATTYDGCVFESRDAGLTWEQGYCDAQHRALASLSLRGGAAVAGGNGGLVIYENRIFVDGFEAQRR